MTSRKRIKHGRSKTKRQTKIWNKTVPRMPMIFQLYVVVRDISAYINVILFFNHLTFAFFVQIESQYYNWTIWKDLFTLIQTMYLIIQRVKLQVRLRILTDCFCLELCTVKCSRLSQQKNWAGSQFFISFPIYQLLNFETDTILEIVQHYPFFSWKCCFCFSFLQNIHLYNLRKIV